MTQFGKWNGEHSYNECNIVLKCQPEMKIDMFVISRGNGPRATLKSQVTRHGKPEDQQREKESITVEGNPLLQTTSKFQTSKFQIHAIAASQPVTEPAPRHKARSAARCDMGPTRNTLFCVLLWVCLMCLLMLLLLLLLLLLLVICYCVYCLVEFFCVTICYCLLLFAIVCFVLVLLGPYLRRLWRAAAR